MHLQNTKIKNSIYVRMGGSVFIFSLFLGVSSTIVIISWFDSSRSGLESELTELASESESPSKPTVLGLLLLICVDSKTAAAAAKFPVFFACSSERTEKDKHTLAVFP